MKSTNKRFNQLQRELKCAMDWKLVLTQDGRVIRLKDEFSPQQIFRSIQECCDTYARHLTPELIHGEKDRRQRITE